MEVGLQELGNGLQWGMNLVRRDGAEWEKLAGTGEKCLFQGWWSEGRAALLSQIVSGLSLIHI